MFVTHPALRLTALTVLVSSLALMHPAYAAPAGEQPVSEGPPSSTVILDQNGHMIGETMDTNVPGTAPTAMRPAPGMSQGPGEHPHAMMHEGGPAQMRMEVEARIKHLHDKLQITPPEENQWSDVAQAMRDNEATISHLIQSRHKTAGNMTAVEDLDSYEQIAQAHADGLKRVIDAFAPLYNNMSDAQKKNADRVFSGFEGHGPMMHGKKMMHGGAHDQTPPANR